MRKVWHSSGRAAYGYLPTWQEFTAEEALWVFSEKIVPKCEIWVGLENSIVVAFLALEGSLLDRLYVSPSHQRAGWGIALVNVAKERRPSGLELLTHQANTAARALYVKLGFVPIRFGVSPPPESAPDVEYHWRPGE